MTTFRNETHAALIALLESHRKSLKLTMKQVAAQMPDYFGWDHTTVAKIAKGRRNISFVETRALAEVYETNIASIDLAIEALQNANYIANKASAATAARPRKKR